MSDKDCCISHQFFETASLNPNKIAVIHASGASQIIKRFHGNSAAHGNDFGDFSFDEFLNASRTSTSHPPVYEGDVCITYSQLLSSVKSLSARIRSILDGSDDPHLFKPTSKGSIELKHESGHSLVGSKSSIESDHLCKRKKSYTPKLVGVYMVPSVEYIVAVLSVLRCGEAFVPLAPSWPKERILSVLSFVALDVIIGCRVPLDGSNNLELDQSHWLLQCGHCPVLCISLMDEVQDCLCSSELTFPCKSETTRSFCYLMYTSGSTGKPKAVCGTEQGLLNRFSWMQELYPLKGEELLLFKTSISFIDHLQEFICSILTASTLVIPPFNDLKGNMLHMADFIQAYNITRLVCVPTLMKVSLPILQSLHKSGYRSSLKLLILSGEVFSISLWEELSQILPETSILNLYGSTEVSGDCTYFDCKSLPALLKTETLSSVPIGKPISNCDVVLVGGENSNDEGEMFVSGHCTFIGYFSDLRTISSDLVQLPDDFLCMHPMDVQRHSSFFKTGDFAKRLQSGDLIFLGRKDRTIKLNGHRIALEEIEDALRGNSYVADAGVIFHGGEREGAVLEAFIVLRQNGSGENLESSLREWLVDRLPLAMIPHHFSFIKSFPMSSSGKVDFASLMSSKKLIEDKVDNFRSYDLHVIEKAFRDALKVEKVSSNDDFFEMGGNSIAAAHVSYNLGIDLRLMYLFRTPSKLQKALFQKEHISSVDVRKDGNGRVELQTSETIIHDIPSHLASDISLNPRKRLLNTHHEENDDCFVISKYSKIDLNSYATTNGSRDKQPWAFCPLHPCAYSRANKITCNEDQVMTSNNQATCAKVVTRSENGPMRQVWKVYMGSCVDASPIIVFKHEDVLLFIGSHSHKFTCVNARSGLVQWTIKLGGRIECPAAVVDNLSQVVVGCYNGKIYFLDVVEGNIRWSFQTGAEVKSEPVVDKQRHLVWCGSHDHNLYALDYRSHCCVHTHPCGGSVFGSPTINEVQGMVYVASTSGCVSALSVKAFPFSTLWQHELGVPVFGSLSSSSSGNVICCLVDGSVVALDLNGSVAWKFKTGGPIFAGASLSIALPSEVLVCSRSGNIYSLELENGHLLWDYDVGDPITSSAYVDENLQLVSESSTTSDRLICICTSSGGIHLLRVSVNSSVGRSNQLRKDNVREFARMDLQGDIFSSPVMIGGRIFIGCRDDYVYCIDVDA